MNPRGKKRPVLKGPSGRMTPVPWVGGSQPYYDRWAAIDASRALDAQYNKLCVVCGLYRGDDWVYALLNGEPYDSTSDAMTILFGGGSPSPTYGHPECILKAVLYCPHLKNQEYPAMLQDRVTKINTDQLKEIVKAKKVLERGPNSFAIGSASMSPADDPKRSHLVT